MFYNDLMVFVHTLKIVRLACISFFVHGKVAENIQSGSPGEQSTEKSKRMSQNVENGSTSLFG